MCKGLDELNKSRSLHLNQITIWTSICKYYAAKVYLNMNPAFSARLCMNGEDTGFCLQTLVTYTVGMARYHNFGFGTIPECNTSVSILNRYHR